MKINMRKTMRGLWVTLILGTVAGGMMSCESEFINGDCNCGRVLSDRIDDYSVVIRNNCTDNSRRFFLSEGDWMNAHPGSDYCITNIGEW